MTPEEKCNIQKVFSTAHRSKKDMQVSGQFSNNVMRRIRNLGLKESSALKWDFISSLVWRFVSPTAFVAITLFTYVTQTGFMPEYEVAEFFLQNPEATFGLSSTR